MATIPDETTERDARLNVALAACLQVLESGGSLAARQRAARYPEFTDELTEFFAGREQFERLAGPLRAVARGGGTSLDTLAAAETPAALTGQCFGDYDVLELLGEGGMAVVWKARHRKLDRLVALKMLRADQRETESELQRLRNEAEMVAHLDHPAIVPVYEVGDAAGQFYFSMKLLDGGSLAGQLERFRDDPRAAAQLVAVVARAIHHAHQRGILHRDLKPSNVLLDAAGAPHVTDFGLARRVEVDSGLTRSGTIVGTPSYMAPEQASGQRAGLTTATDVHGLGAVLYALLAGQPPFQGETVLDTLVQVLERDPEPPGRRNPHLDRDLETICLKCLQKEPQRRYGSAEAVADDLERWLAGLPIQARPIGRAERLWRWCRRNPVVAGLSAAVLVLLLVAAGVLVVSRVKIGMALEREAEQRRRAEASYHLAREGLEQCVQKVAEDPRLQSGPLEDLRRSIRAAEKAFYEKFVDLRGADPGFQQERARAYRRLAFVTQELGSKEEALEHYRRAVAISSKLAADHPGVAEYQADLWTSYNNLGEMCRQAARMQDAEQPLQDALGVAKGLVRDHPEEIEYQFDLARNQINLGLLFRETHRPREAEQAYGEARAVLQATLGRHPEHADCQAELARTWTELGLLYKDTARPKEAERAFEDSLTLHRALVHEHPQEAEYRLELARNLSNLGTWYGETKQLPRAEQALNDAVALLTVLVQEHPAVAEYQLVLAMARGNLGNFYQDAGRFREAEDVQRQAVGQLKQLTDAAPTFPEYQHRLGAALHNLATLLLRSDAGEARRLLEQAIGCQRAALQANPRNPVYRFHLRAHHGLLAEALLRLEEHGGASKAALEVPTLFPDDWQAHLTAALLLARCVPLAEKDSKLAEAKRRELVQGYGDQAMKLLQQAVRKGFRDGQALEKEAALAPLRSRAEFAQIMTELERKEQQ